MKFKVIDSKIPPSFNPEDDLDTITAEDFLDSTKSNRARLIWCKSEQINFWKTRATGFTVYVDEELINVARKLTPKDCAIVTKLKMMRGTDLKAANHVIDLLI